MTANENPIHFTCQGEGMPAILVHGLSASRFDWLDLQPALAQAGYTAYALDLPGHGLSGGPQRLADYSAGRIFDCFADWIESLPLAAPLTLVGHSLGGYLSIEYALRYPERIRALVLADPFYTPHQLPRLLRRRYKRPLPALGLLTRAPQWLVRIAVDLTSLSLRNGYQLPKAVRDQTARDYLRVTPGVYNIPITIRDLTPDLPRITAPTLVIWGQHDRTLTPASFRKLACNLPNARTAALPAGHVPHQSHPAEFNRHVLEFLQTVVVSRN
jgi:pimeloyl-ACP methyl ester carboxylesterase